jgi:hypothetical protein
LNKIICYVSPEVDVYFVGRVLAGVFEQPDARVRIKMVDWITDSASVGIEVNGMRFGIQLSDHRDFWDAGLLDWCDVYAKRNLHPDFQSTQPRKVVPFAVYCAGTSKRSMLHLVATMATDTPSSLWKRWRELLKYAATPHWSDYEMRPDESVTDTVLFQTRLWEPEDAPGDFCINEERVALVVALKKAFGKRFVGGLVPNRYALEHYPQHISDRPHRPAEYIGWAKKSAIGVYSRGLFGSIAFKMAEFFASSKCIVSEPVSNQLLGQIDHVPVFDSIEHCVSICGDLLSNSTKLKEQRQLAWEYYQQHVLPKTVIARLIKPAIT